MKRKTVFLLSILMLMSAFCLYAKGTQEVTSEMDNRQVTSKNLISSVFSGLGNRITVATEQLCLNLTPFPAALSYYYADEFGMTKTDVSEDGEQVFLFNLLNTRGNQSTAAGIESEAGISYGSSQEKEKKVFGMVTKIFAALLILEVLFTSIWGYITDKEGSLLKQVLSRILIGFLAFLLVSALPFLVEAMKVGFAKAAVTLTGTEDTKAGKKILETSVFHLPEIYLETCGEVLDLMDPEKVGDSNMDIISGSGFSIKVLYRITYFIARIIAGILCCLVTIHIVMNIAEVYLVLALATVLIPFMTFSPLKMFGEKAINALFANVLELFVIIVILLTCVNVAQQTIYDYLLTVVGTATKTTIYFQFETENDYEAVKSLTGLDIPEQYRNSDDDSAFLAFTLIHTFDSKTGKGNLQVGAKPEEVKQVVADWYLVFYQNLYEKKQLSFTEYRDYYTSSLSGHKMTSEQVANNTNPKTSHTAPPIKTVPSGDIAEMNNMIYRLLEQTSAWVTVDTEYPLEEGNTNERLMTIHLILCFFILLFSVKFINDSSQITNSLLMGSLWTFGIDGMGMRGALTRSMRVASAPIRLAGKAAGAAGATMMRGYSARRRAADYASASNGSSDGQNNNPSGGQNSSPSSDGGSTPPGANTTPGGSHS